MAHKYTAEQLAWLKAHRPKLQIKALSSIFNARFGTQLGNGAIAETCQRHGIKAGGSGRFSKGHNTWNKNIKGMRVSPRTEFKKGDAPINILPVGTERFKDGYVWTKIAEPDVWRHKHRLIWESKHGPQPPGTTIIFLDGDLLNFEPDNLQCVTRAELLQLNRNKYRQAHDDLKPAILGLSKLECALFKVQKEARP